MTEQTQDSLARKNKRTALTILGVVIGMVALAYASVPLYNLFCRVTGFGGTTQVAAEAPVTPSERTIKVRFDASTARNMPWDFGPEERQVTVKLGEKRTIKYHATNKGGETITGTALYNVTPPKAGKYFNKIQCFCFGEQVLKPGESAEFPAVFFVDPKLADDPDMQDVTTITLSYSFFRAESSDLDKAMKDFYNR